jgi:hypothetical protein
MPDKYNPDCLRKVANWSAIKSIHKFDVPRFEPESVLKDMPYASPKLDALMKNIRKLDEEDMKTRGKLFKHFIFSEVKMGGYGSKIITSALIASGMKMVYRVAQDGSHFVNGIRVPSYKLVLYPDSELIQTKGNNVALLSSTTVFQSNVTVGVKKAILSKYNERPANINGDLIRFIVLDGGFKEGIDLFDVKYVHVFEPQRSKADQTQVIGRATRTCGQKGLEFHPTRGWPLHVFMYDVNVTDEMKSSLGADTLFKAYITHSGIDLRKMVFADELERAVIVGSVDYELTKNVHRFRVDEDDFDLGGLFQGGAYGTELKCGADSKCSTRRPTKDVPINNPLLVSAYIALGKEIPASLKPSKMPRAFFCNELKVNPEYCAMVNRLYKNPKEFMGAYRKVIQTAIHTNKHTNLPQSMRSAFVRFFKSYIETGVVIVDESLDMDRDQEEKEEKVDEEIEVKERPASRPVSQPVSQPISQSKEKSEEKKEEKKEEEKGHRFERRMNFLETRRYIQEKFGQYKWPHIRMENACIPKAQQEGGEQMIREVAKALITSVLGTRSQRGGASEVLSLSPTQDFIRNYFVPSLPQRGMLLFHGVGVGKTCTAIASATSSFEKEGYTILWVTRTTLKSDIWKNMFDQVCSESISSLIRSGVEIPKEQTDRLRLLSKSWSVRPMSYRQFSNLVAGKNDLYDSMVKRNGKEDPLRRTLLIIDEAHKLYGGSDLSEQEKPDMDKLHKTLMKSYRVSGKDSVRVLLMTATPYTNEPMEMIQLLNLLRGENEQLEVDYEQFADKYLDEDGHFTKKGRFQFLNDIAGYVSYLNRERDARQFAQPKLHVLNSMMSSKVERSVKDIRAEYKPKLDELKEREKTQTAENKKTTKEFKEEEKNLRDSCKGTRGNARKECFDKLKDKFDELNKKKEEYKTKSEETEKKTAEEKEKVKAELDEELKKAKIPIFQNLVLNKKCRVFEGPSMSQSRDRSMSRSRSRSASRSASRSQPRSQEQQRRQREERESNQRAYEEKRRREEAERKEQEEKESELSLPKTPTRPSGDTDSKERLANYMYHELRRIEKRTGRMPRSVDVIGIASRLFPGLNEKRYKLLLHPDKCDDCSENARKKMNYVFQCLIRR